MVSKIYYKIKANNKILAIAIGFILLISILTIFLFLDIDNDGLNNYHEFRNGTKYNIDDSDGDGLIDGDEINIFRTNPNSMDSDNDKLLDNLELLRYNTNPNKKDTDNDGLFDFHEVMEYGTNASSNDTDNDGLLDFKEVMEYGTNASSNDTDNDGLLDFDELFIYKTNATSRDSDLDWLNDYEELFGWENIGFTWKTDPLKKDTDEDGVNDKYDYAPNGNLIIYLNITEWRAPNEGQDDDSDPDSWFLVLSAEDWKITQLNKTRCWYNQTYWEGDEIISFDIEDDDVLEVIEIRFLDWDGQYTTRYDELEYNLSDLMDINPYTDSNESWDQYLSFSYRLWNNQQNRSATLKFSYHASIEGQNIYDSSTDSYFYSFVSASQDGNDDGDSNQYDCFIAFQIWWSYI